MHTHAYAKGRLRTPDPLINTRDVIGTRKHDRMHTASTVPCHVQVPVSQHDPRFSNSHDYMGATWLIHSGVAHRGVVG